MITNARKRMQRMHDERKHVHFNECLNFFSNEVPILNSKDKIDFRKTVFKPSTYPVVSNPF